MSQAISYIRFSSAKQGTGSSVERQEAMLGAWLKRHPEYVLSSIKYADYGKSGFKGEHLENGFGKLQAAIDFGVIPKGSVVLVEAIDRAGRLAPLKMIEVLSRILTAGVHIVTLDDEVMYTEESVNGPHLFLLAAKIQQANTYSENLSRRVTASYKSREVMAKAGKTIKRSVPMWLNSDGTLNPDVAPYMKQAFEDAAVGIGERRILRRLCEASSVFNGMTSTTLKRWMRNKTAIGYWPAMVDKNGKIVRDSDGNVVRDDIPNVYPPVVDADLFYRVQSVFNARKKFAAPTSNFLTGLVICSECGSNYNKQISSRNPGIMDTMKCGQQNRENGKKCENVASIPIVVLEWIVKSTCLHAVRTALKSQHLSENGKRLIAIDVELQEVEKGLGNLASAIASVGAVPEIVAKLEMFRSQREELQNEKALLSGEAVELDITPESVEEALASGDILRLNAMLQSVSYVLTGADRNVSVGLQTFRYGGIDRKTGSFKIHHKGQVVLLERKLEGKAVQEDTSH
ncbi:recombinase family protein [Pseudomonas sp. FP2294]|uniref:recombinase family protein n=1 Tax=Pseudomonas sp. FP2294 TaxID=2954089 RepID=UPI002733DC56|nr:recombinase family protein [Pseudomonas sp. FP2294]WLH59633.1 recombinase family protein [Pseudomonas sp. FP2294]